MDLMASRHTGFAMGPIWWSEIQKYAEAKGLDEAQTEAMHHHVRAMDTAYMKHHSKKGGK